MNDLFWQFVAENATADPQRLRLKYHGKSLGQIDVDFAILQIECRQQFGKKLAQTLLRCPTFYFPDRLVGEQATSDALASVHADLICSFLSATRPEGTSEKPWSAVDLTAGLGIDAFHLAWRGLRISAVEMDMERANALMVNAKQMGIDDRDFELWNCDCAGMLQLAAERGLHYDVAYIDPARRDLKGARVYALADCQPDVVALLPDLRRVARWLVVKMSPMLDASQVASELPHPALIAAIGTPTECRELLAVVDLAAEQPDSPTLFRSITVGAPPMEFTAQAEREAQPAFIAPQESWTLYEPYPSVMKLGPYRLLSSRYGLSALHPNSHLYCSPSPVADVPAQAYAIEAVLPWSSSEIKRFAKRWPKISVAVRNFPLPAETVRRKLHVSEGDGSLMVFATTALPSQPILIVARRLSATD